MASKEHCFDPDAPAERRRLVLTLVPAHWAVEWIRPITPNFKLVGPLLARPGQPLPDEIDVSASSTSQHVALHAHCRPLLQ